MGAKLTGEQMPDDLFAQLRAVIERPDDAEAGARKDGSMNLAKKKQRERFLRRLAAEPFGSWERRELGADLFRAACGFEPTREVAAITHGFLNNRYAVQVSEIDTDWGRVTHLWIRRHDSQPVRSWPDLQRIKNEIAGPDRLAVEVFPPQSEVVDLANMLHLWVLPVGFTLPFGLKGSQ